jgi:AraC-like DNA-binding protein
MQEHQPSTGPEEFRRLYNEAPLTRAAVGWLRRNNTLPEELVAEAMRDLKRRGRTLPGALRVRYAARVVLGEFFARWSAKHRGRTVKSLSEDAWVREAELKPFQLAIMAAGDESAFRRITPQLARKRMAERGGMTLGTAEEFTAFVAENTELLADRFLENFDSTRPDAAHKAVRYLQKTAVSYYLVRRTRPIREDAPNLMDYLRGSPRLSPRTVLAVKLAYLPMLLTHEDRQTLRQEYACEGSLARRMPIKEIARVLGYKNAAALSRKLYRIRDWCRRSQPTTSKGGR